MQAQIAARISEVRGRIARAAERCGRDPAEVHLIGAAKTMSPAVVRVAIEAGLSEVGENYVQEAIEAKTEIDAMSLDAPVRWHLIGHLQRNKAKRAVELFDVIQTVDRVALGRALARHAAALGKVLSVLIEVNVAGEASKSGIAPDEVGELVAELRGERALSLDGLMAIPPISDEQEARGYFRRLRELGEQHGLRELSMGMTNDFEVAIEEGATMVRVGRAIFGERRQ